MVHLLYLACASVWLVLAFIQAAWFFRFRALNILALPQPDALTSKEKRRLQHYFYGTTYLSVILCTLRGQPRSRREKRLFTNLAALAYFFDDLVDAFRGRDDTGLLWQDNPEVYGHAADERGIALHFLHHLYLELPPGDLAQFKEFMHRVFNVETAGRQMNNALQINDLANITAEKGGYSVLLFRRVLSHPLSSTEHAALYQFGYLIQLCDDIFDLWHDHQAGMCTLATVLAEQQQISELNELFESQVVTVRTTFYQLGRPLHGHLAWAVVYYLVTITRVCLRHYGDLEKKHGTLPLRDRSLLVVDMERSRFRWRAVQQFLRGRWTTTERPSR